MGTFTLFPSDFAKLFGNTFLWAFIFHFFPFSLHSKPKSPQKKTDNWTCTNLTILPSLEIKLFAEFHAFFLFFICSSDIYTQSLKKNKHIEGRRVLASFAATQSLSQQEHASRRGSGWRWNYSPQRAWRGSSPGQRGRETRGLLGVVVLRPCLAAAPAPVCSVGGGDGSTPHCCPQATAGQLRLAPQPGTTGGGMGDLWR